MIIHKKQYTLIDYQELPKWRLTKYLKILEDMKLFRINYASTILWYKHNYIYQDLDEK